MQFTQEEAVVNEVEGGFAYLAADNADCKSCSSVSGCSSFSFFSNSPNRVLKVSNTMSLEQGDRVIVELKVEKLVLGTFMVYILPLISLLLFAGFGKLFLGEGSSILFGIAGFSLSLLIIKYVMLKKDVSEQFEPKILKKIITINPTS